MIYDSGYPYKGGDRFDPPFATIDMKGTKAMGNEIIVFTEELIGQVRTVQKDNEVYFSVTDVCKCIGLTKPNRSIKEVDKEDVHKFQAKTAGGTQTLNYVNESGLYQLIFLGKTEKAKNFRRWVTRTVLPSIRKTGRFSLPKGIKSVEEMREIQRIVDQYLESE